MSIPEKNKNVDSYTIGGKIRQLVIENGLTTNAVIAYLDGSEETLERIYGSNSIDIENLIKLSELLNFNLLIYYFNNKVIKDLFEDRMIDLSPQVDNLISLLETKDDEIARLRALLETQRKIIDLCEAKALFQDLDKEAVKE